MADDLTFNILANFAQAAAAFAEGSRDVDSFKRKLEELNRSEASPKLKADAADLTAKLVKAQRDLDDLNNKKVNPKVDLDISAEEAKRDKVKVQLKELEDKKTTPEIDLLIKNAESQIERLNAKLDVLRNKPVTVKTDAEIAAAEEKLDRLRKNVEALDAQRADPKVDAEIAGAEANLAIIEDKLRQLNDEKADPKIDADILAAEAKLAKLKAELDSFNDKYVTVHVDTNKASADIGAFATKMTKQLDAAIKALPAIKITADSTDADRKLAELRAKLQALRDVTVTGKFDSKQMSADIAKVEAELKALGAKKVDVSVKADTASARGELEKLSKAGDSLAQKFKNLDLGSSLAAGISGAIIPLLASIGQLSGALGLLPGLAAAAGQSFAALKIGTMGVSESIKDFAKLDDLASKAADTNAAAQQAQATASQANATAGGGVVASLKQQVAQGAANVASLKAQAAQQQATGTATSQATAQHLGQVAALKQAQAAGASNVASLKQQAAQGAANVASIKAQTAAHGGNNPALKQAEANQAALNAQLKQAEANLKGSTAATGAAASATADAKLKTSEATSAQKAYDKALENYKNSLTNLSPAAKDFVVQLAAMVPALKDLKAAVQENLFKGLADELKQMGDVVLPVVKTGLSQMATSLNDVITKVTQFTTKQSSVSAWKQIFENNALAVHNLSGAVQPLLSIFTQVAQVGSTFLPQLAQHFADAATKAAEFVAQAKETGKLHEWIQTGIQAVHDLWDAFKNVVAIIKDFATLSIGPNFLVALRDITGFVRFLLEKFPPLTSLVQAFIDAWVLAKITQGLIGMVSTITNVTSKISEMTTKVTGSAAAGEKMSAVMKQTAIAGGVLLAGLTAVAAIWTAYTTDVDTAAAAMLKGGAAASDMTAKINDQLTPFGKWLANLTGLAATTENATAKSKEMLAGMDPLTRAQTLQTQALSDYLNDLDKLGPSNQKTIDDQKRLSDATGRVTTEQDKENAALGKVTKSLKDQSAAITSEVDANVAWHTSLDALNTAVAQNGTTLDINTTAGRANISAVSDLVKAAAAEEAAFKATSPSAADLSTKHAELSTKLQDTVGKLGLVGPAVNGMVGSFVAAKPALDLTPTINTSPMMTGIASIVAAISGVKSPPPVAFTGNTDDLKAKASQGESTIMHMPFTHMTTFTGDGTALLVAAAGGTTAVQSVVPDWLTKFAGDTSNLITAASTSAAALEGVKSTHGTSFTGDSSGLTAAASQSTSAINAVVQPAPIKFTGDITGLTTAASTATSQITAVATAHDTKLTADVTNVTQAASTATQQINAVPLTHATKLTVDSAAALQQIQQFIQYVNSIPTSHVTVIQTVRTGAAGMLLTMADGGVLPMAKGDNLSPNMRSGVAEVIHPNTWRVIGDNMTHDEAFIPIDKSARSLAILAETAERMGYGLMGMRRGGYHHRGRHHGRGRSGSGRGWDDEDEDEDEGEDFWEWWRHHRGGGGGGGGGFDRVASPVYASRISDITENIARFGGGGNTASITHTGAKYVDTGTYSYRNVARPSSSGGGRGGGAGGGGPISLHISSGGSRLDALLMELLRKAIRVQGGNTQLVLGD